MKQICILLIILLFLLHGIPFLVYLMTKDQDWFHLYFLFGLLDILLVVFIDSNSNDIN